MYFLRRHRQKHFKTAIWGVIALLSWVSCPKPADAHPHLFIVQRLLVTFDDTGVAGIRVIWKMDNMFADMIVDDYDANNNGTFEPEEVSMVKEKAFSYISDHNYFSFVNIDGDPFEVKSIEEFNAVLNQGRLFYEFTIPCRAAAADHVRRLTVATYDPTYYSAVYFADENPVYLIDADAYEVDTSVKEDLKAKYYNDTVSPWTLFLEFRKKS